MIQSIKIQKKSKFIYIKKPSTHKYKEGCVIINPPSTTMI